MKQLYLDLDGVLADFDKAYAGLFGAPPLRGETDPPGMWAAIDKHGSFYLDLEPMPDMNELWSYARRHDPIILTGVPNSVHLSGEHKRLWVKKHLGGGVRVITCKSAHKSQFAAHGDVLVDDWTKYTHLWERVGGVWITHTSARKSIMALKEVGL